MGTEGNVSPCRKGEGVCFGQYGNTSGGVAMEADAGGKVGRGWRGRKEGGGEVGRGSLVGGIFEVGVRAGDTISKGVC